MSSRQLFRRNPEKNVNWSHKKRASLSPNLFRSWSLSKSVLMFPKRCAHPRNKIQEKSQNQSLRNGAIHQQLKNRCFEIILLYIFFFNNVQLEVIYYSSSFFSLSSSFFNSVAF